MALFYQHESCRGLTLLLWGRWSAELWYCPRGYEIKPHLHPHEDIELVPVFGWAAFHRCPAKGVLPETAVVTPRRWFRRHTVPMGWVHWFTVGRRLPLVFINVARWREGVTPTSAATDFLPA